VTDLVAPPELQVFYMPMPMVSVDVTDEALTNGKRTEGTQFFLAGDKWVYNLATKEFTEVGSYRAIMVSGDPSEIESRP